MSDDKKLLLNVRELADLYALKTLYDYLTDTSFDARLFFSGSSIGSERAQQVLQGAKTRSFDGSIDAVVSCFSDIGGGSVGFGHNLEVDIAVLKNCVKPLTEAEKQQLREKYKISSEKPIVVVGYAYSGSALADLVRELAGKATFFFVGSGVHESLKGDNSVIAVTKHGVLKDYYAMADVAINANNLEPTSSHLHNFVEATEGGPLFMVQPQNTAQYGYTQLLCRGVIRTVISFDYLVQAVKAYLQNFRRTSEHSDKRSAHINLSRGLYLPAIASFIDFMLGRTNHLPDSAGLRVEQDGKCTRLVHPSSDWRYNQVSRVYSQKNFILTEIKEPDLNDLAKQLSRLGEIIHSFQPRHLHEKNSNIIYSREQEMYQRIYHFSKQEIPEFKEQPDWHIQPQTKTKPKKKSPAHSCLHPKEDYNDEFENTPLADEIKRLSEKYVQYYHGLDKYTHKILPVK